MILVFFAFISCVNARNIIHNARISLDLDLDNPDLTYIWQHYNQYDHSIVYYLDPEDRVHYTIGRVIKDGNVLYSDSDVLIQRSVFHFFNENGDPTIIQINSVYADDVREVQEVIEFAKGNDSIYREIQRIPIDLDLKSLDLIPDVIDIKSRHGGTQIEFDILQNKDTHVIGTVKFGNVVIDRYDSRVITKKVIEEHGEEGKIIIETIKITRQGECISTICLMIFEGGESHHCRELRRSVTNVS